MSFVPRNHEQQVRRRGADDDVDTRGTPQDLYDELHDEFGFTLDAAANADNAKCAAYYTRETDGLASSWGNHRVWCNPPYSNLKAWVEKGFAEVRRGCPLVVFLLPANRSEQAWWQDMVEPVRDRGLGVRTKFVRRRRHFTHCTRGVGSPPFGLVVLILEREHSLFGGAP